MNSATETTKLSDSARRDWLRLIRSDNIGPRGIMAHVPQEKGRSAPKSAE